MEKKEFVYQRWLLKMFCAVIVLLLVFTAEYIVQKLTGIKYESFWFNLILKLVIATCIFLYCKHTEHNKFFIRNGAYWVENGVVYIQTGKKTHELKNVKALSGTAVSAYFMARGGMLKVDYGKKTLTLVSPLTEPIKSFSASGLVPLFETILVHNPKLVKDDTVDYLYEIK